MIDTEATSMDDERTDATISISHRELEGRVRAALVSMFLFGEHGPAGMSTDALRELVEYHTTRIVYNITHGTYAIDSKGNAV
jgi:hypothetical protein